MYRVKRVHSIYFQSLLPIPYLNFCLYCPCMMIARWEIKESGLNTLFLISSTKFTFIV